MRVNSFLISALILIAFFFYDIFWVFLSSCIFGKNVMVTVALGLPSLPIVIALPRVFSDHLNILGLGDVVLPGLVLAYLFRFDQKHAGGILRQRGYFLIGLLGYAIGLEIAFAMLPAFQRAQPALLYLVPGVLLPTLLTALLRGEIPLLWYNRPVDHNGTSSITVPLIGEEDAEHLPSDTEVAVLDDPDADNDRLLASDPTSEAPSSSFSAVERVAMSASDEEDHQE